MQSVLLLRLNRVLSSVVRNVMLPVVSSGAMQQAVLTAVSIQTVKWVILFLEVVTIMSIPTLQHM